MNLDDTVYYNELFDIYSELLTEKQKMYFKDYFFDNLSLGEISEKYNISRNAIFKQIHIVVDKLLDFEDKLTLYERQKKLNFIIESIDDDNLKSKLEELLD